jgi:hypothetical protein
MAAGPARTRSERREQAARRRTEERVAAQRRTEDRAAARRRTEDRVLDSHHLTVLGVLLGLGATVGLSVGFNVGGLEGLIAGVLSGMLTPVLLALAFRSRRTRYWLAAIADWVVERPLEEAVKDVHQLTHGLDNELEKALDHLDHANHEGHMWSPAEAPPVDFWEAHDDDLRSMGWRYHKPVRDAYRKMDDLNELARQRAEYRVAAGISERQRDLSGDERQRLQDASRSVHHALERIQELDQTADC